jgi:hypothetical protein
MTKRHYSHQEWIHYRARLLPDTVRRNMEEHLSHCEPCLEIYLSCIGEDEMELADLFLPEDFTSKILQRVIDYSQTHKTSYQGLFKPQNPSSAYLVSLRNYLLAGVMTTVLLLGGWFAAMPSIIESGWPKSFVQVTLPSWPEAMGTRLGKWLEGVFEDTGVSR